MNKSTTTTKGTFLEAIGNDQPVWSIYLQLDCLEAFHVGIYTIH